jgi:nucleotide-binding universal stress UspA family protein
MKVLLAIDPSHASPVADTAIMRPWPEGTVFCTMSVVDTRLWEGLPTLVEDARRQAERVVQAAIDKLTSCGYRAFTEIATGSPKKEITEYAKNWNADLIMVGSHHRSLDRFLLGSVAHAILHSAACSVEIVRPTPPPSATTKLLLATDGSDCSAYAVDFLASRPWPAGTQIRILSVIPFVAASFPSFASAFITTAPEFLDEICRQAQSRARKAVADAQATLEGNGLKVCTCEATPEGEPRAVILDDAKSWGADLIVLGSHGRHGVERILLGGVSEAVASHANCSVEVVR